MPRRSLTTQQYAEGLQQHDRGVLSRAITLIESSRSDDRHRALALLDAIMPLTGQSIRLGISGVPGVGKSTFIESLGMHVLGDGSRRLAVLAVDPSSSRSGGSILGDKTRMQQLSAHADVYIRPSPAAGALGGVTRVTRETMLLCEAAGYDTVFVETVGVGQSEITVASMVDFYLVLMLPGAGDDLQGIKKGVLEIADQIVVNKSDGELQIAAAAAAAAYKRALEIVTAHDAKWHPPVSTCSALEEVGISDVWQTILQYQLQMQGNGYWLGKRQQQHVAWLGSLIAWHLQDRFRQHPEVKAALAGIEQAVEKGELSPGGGAARLMQMMNI